MKDVKICGSMMRARIIISCFELDGGGTGYNPTIETPTVLIYVCFLRGPKKVVDFLPLIDSPRRPAAALEALGREFLRRGSRARRPPAGRGRAGRGGSGSPPAAR